MAAEAEQETLAKQKSDEGSASYPYYTIEDLLPRIRKIAGHFGIGAQPAPRKEVCILLEKKEPTLIYFFGTALQYGLLENIPAKGVIVKNLFQDIEHPVYGDAGRRSAMLTAFSNPPIYKKLIDKFNGAMLPNEAGLANLLRTKEYGVNANSAARAAKIFYENGKLLDIIDSGNRLKFLLPKLNGVDADSDAEQEAKPKENTPPPAAGADNTTFKFFDFPIDLTGEKIAYLRYPKGQMSSEDVDALEIMVTAAIAAIRATLKIKPKENKNEVV